MDNSIFVHKEPSCKTLERSSSHPLGHLIRVSNNISSIEVCLRQMRHFSTQNCTIQLKWWQSRVAKTDTRSEAEQSSTERRNTNDRVCQRQPNKRLNPTELSVVKTN